MDNKKMLKIINLLENANQNHSEIPLYNPWDGYNFFFKGNCSVAGDVEKSEPS